jgi:uncharacterized protein (AIM24 family)
MKAFKFGNYVTVYVQEKDVINPEHKVTVSWSAIGSVDIDMAYDFSVDLGEALMFAIEQEGKVLLKPEILN